MKRRGICPGKRKIQRTSGRSGGGLGRLFPPPRGAAAGSRRALSGGARGRSLAPRGAVVFAAATLGRGVRAPSSRPCGRCLPAAPAGVPRPLGRAVVCVRRLPGCAARAAGAAPLPAPAGLLRRWTPTRPPTAPLRGRAASRRGPVAGHRPRSPGPARRKPRAAGDFRRPHAVPSAEIMYFCRTIDNHLKTYPAHGE